MKIVNQFIKATLIIFTILIFGSVGTYLLVGNATLLAWIDQGIEKNTGAKISYGPDARITRTLSPIFSTNDFSYEDGGKFKFQTDSLKIQINLPGLLFGKLKIPLLNLGNTRIELEQSDEESEPGTSGTLAFIPVFEDLNIARISVVYGNKELNLSKMDINDFSVRIDPDNDQILCTLKSEFEGHTFGITATLPRIQKILESNQVPFSLNIKNKVAQLYSKGLYDFSSTPATIDADFKGSTGWLSASLSGDLGSLKRIDFSAKVLGELQKLNFQKCRLDLKTQEGLYISAAGQFNLVQDKSGFNPENIDLAVKFEAPDTRSARVLFFDAIPEFGAIHGKVDIKSQKGDPSLENIVVEARDTDGIKVDLKGRIAKFPIDPDTSITGYDLDVIMTSREASILGERAGLHLSLDGPLNLSYRIEGDTQALQLTKIDFAAGKKDKAHIRTAGRILFGDWNQPDPMENIDLKVEVTSRNTQAIGAIIGEQLPELGPIAAKARLHTVSQNHRIDDIHGV